MTIKLSGKDFKKFYTDKEYWPEDMWHESETVTVEGVELEESYDYTEIADDAVVRVTGGVVQRDSAFDKDESMTFERFLKIWIKRQSRVRLIVEVHKDDLSSFKSTIRGFGWKIL
jgi:hypothetical protein